VIGSTPKEGLQAAKGSPVTLIVSSGTPMSTVPNLKCMTERQAEDALAAAGFKAKFSGSGQFVVDQDPAPNASEHKGTYVTAYMGSGVFLGCS
jgi:beta-lactam-binding protein with PASTA domain